jgi:hypothetical protein
MRSFLTAVDKTFGFIWQQPIYLTLRSMCFIQVGLVINSQLLLWEVAGMLKEMGQIEAAAALGGIAAALIGQNFAAVTSISKSGKQDG